LGEKGIREYAAAARIVKDRFPQSRFVLVGPLDPSPDGLSLDQVQAWHDSGTLVYQGATDDVRPFLRDCHVYCLPSYHEGMPRTVLEALAIGRPVLTTNVSGCKETVVPGQNGWLVPHANIDALVERMFWFLENQDQWQNMGQASRKLAEEKFDVKKINEDMLRILNGTK
jgi:glycosyltransferase involved in cell wall biosynthesis